LRSGGKRTSAMLTFGSLFAGIGGIDLGLERAGMRCAWQVELDDYATRVLAKHWPNVPKFRDVRECGAHNLPAVDLICGGFPCQPHSTAGKRKGAADDRNLWPEFARVIRELRPRWVMAENVPGLLSTDAGRFFGAVLGELATFGYDAEWECIPAAAIGAPHIRDRVYLVAYAANTIRRQINGELADCQGTRGNQAQERSIRQGDGCPEHDRFTKGGSTSRGPDVAYAQCERLEEPRHIDTTRMPAASGADVADSSIARSWRLAAGQQGPEVAPADTHRRGQDVADAERNGWREGTQDIRAGQSVAPDGGDYRRDVPDADRERCGGRPRIFQAALPGGRLLPQGDHPWAVEPSVGRMAHGVPARVDRLRGLGNAVVPEVAELIGRWIVDAEQMGL